MNNMPKMNCEAVGKEEKSEAGGVIRYLITVIYFRCTYAPAEGKVFRVVVCVVALSPIPLAPQS